MTHSTLARFWRHYDALPKDVQKVADQQFERLKADSRHPSLHFKRVGKRKELWSVRVGMGYRALARERSDGVVWFWIGTHAEYDLLIS